MLRYCYLISVDQDRLEDVFSVYLVFDLKLSAYPFLFCKTLACVHFTRRTKTSQENYWQIGGGSPLQNHRSASSSEQLQQKEEARLCGNALLASTEEDRQN